MQLRYIIAGIAVLILGLAGCRQETNVPRSESVLPDELSRTTGLQYPVRLEAAELDKHYITLAAYVDGYPAPATMVGPEDYRYVFSWKRNGEPITNATFAAGTYRSTVSQRMAASSTNDPFAKEVEEHFWELTVTDREQPGLSSTVVTSVTFTRDCGEYPGYVYVDCEGEGTFVFAASITEAVPGDAVAQEAWLRRALEHHILGPDGTDGHTRFRNFANWVLRAGYSGTEVEENRIDPETYELADGYAWSPPLLMDDAMGAPMYAGLISDTISGVQQGGASDVRTSYYARQTYQAPFTDGSSPHGGSGAGRDRLGAGAYPYAFGVEQGIFSDNPNNCARPADACSVAGVQDGGPEWQSAGPLGGCEYPNVSNNSDDATFKVSEQITSIIPFMQGELMSLVPLKGR